jgi:hypothetical protein
MNDQNNALTVWEKPENLRARLLRILEVQKNVMKKDIDYGIIPGCEKPSLFKPGSEILLVTFVLAALEPKIIDLCTENERRYRVLTTIVLQGSQIPLGTGVGECSSNEEKYKWRKAVCNEEWEETPIDLRREKWFKSKDGRPAWKQKQIRTNPSDVANTILKMAKKRSMIDGTLQVTAASHVFTQDIEDMSREFQEVIAENENVKNKESTKPVITQPTMQVITEKQEKRLYAICKKSGVDINKLKEWLSDSISVQHLKDIPTAEYEMICTAVEKSPQKINSYVKRPVDEPQEQEPDLAEVPVMDHEQFKNEVIALAEKAGIDKIDEFIKMQTKIDGLENVPVDSQSLIIDLFIYQIENAGK